MSTVAPIRFRVLGPVCAVRDGEELPLGAPRQRVVLAALLLADGHTASVTSLFEAVWGQCPPRTARASLRNSVSRLRAVLGDDVLVSTDDGYTLRVEDFDLAEADRLIGRARGTADPTLRHAALTAADRLWTGEPLAGLDGGFVRFQRSRLADLRMTVTENRLSVEVELGGGVEVIEQLRRLCRDYPFREEPHRLLMLALHRSRRDREAIAVYDALRRRLVESLGIDPGTAVAMLRERIRHDGTAPPAPGPAPGQLPAAVTAFTGRRRLHDALTAALTAPRAPVAVLSGLGGVGKTALALHIAHRLRHRFGDGQLFADLRGTEADPVSGGAVLGRFLRALGVPEPEIPEDTARRSRLFASVTAGKRVLVLLDNARDAEQVRPLLSVGDAGAVLVTSRARLTGLDGVSSFDVDVLEPDEAHDLFRAIVGTERVTADFAASRAVVAACGHLPLAVRIAASRALSRPRWPLFYLAERLDDANHRLDELRDDDRSVAAAFAMSYAHLDRWLADCFRRLTVIDLPNLTLAEAAAVLRRPGGAVAADLASLVDLGLLATAVPGRFHFHDLVRLFGSRRATPDEHRTGLDRLLRHYLTHTVAAVAVAHPDKHQQLSLTRRTAVPDMAFVDRVAAVDWLNDIAPRVLTAVRQAARGDPDAVDPAADLMHSIAQWAGAGSQRQSFIDTATELAEAARRHGNAEAELRARLALLQCLALWRPRAAEPHGRRVLLLAEEHGGDVLRAEAYSLFADALANCALEQRPRQVLEYMSRAIEYFDRAPGLSGRAASVRSARALALAILGDFDEALTEADRAVTVLRGLGDEGALAVALFQHGLALFHAGRVEAARALFAESRDLAHAHRDRPLEMLALYHLARLHAAAGAVSMTMVYATQAVAMSTELDDDDKLARSLAILGQSLRHSGSPRRARSLLTEALRVFEQLEGPDAGEQQRLLLAQLGEDWGELEAA